jgi:integrase
VSIQKRGKSYYVRYRRDGQHLGRSFVRKADAEAFELEQKRLRQMGAHMPAVPSRETLDAWLDEWWSSESARWAKATRVQWKHSLDKWVRPYIGRTRLADLGPRRAREWRAAILDHGASASVANHAKEVLSAALGAAVESNLLPANPASGMRKLPTPPRRPRALTPSVVEQGVAQMLIRDRVFVELLCYAGLRPGEALALRWPDVRDSLLVIDKSYSYGELKGTKTHSRRTVDIIPPLADDLAMLREWQAGADDLVIANHDGGYVDLANWRRRVWKKAFGDSSPYDGRHTYASLLIHEGRSLPYVTAALGHSSAKTTLDHYAHVYAEAQLETSVRMVDAIAEARRRVLETCSPGSGASQPGPTRLA